MRDEIEAKVAKDAAEKLLVAVAREKWYSQPTKPSRQLGLTSEERNWLARHVRYLREAGKDALAIRRNALKGALERDEAWDKWHESDDGQPRKPSRQMGLTQLQRDFLARYLRWERSNPEPESEEIEKRRTESWLTGRPDPLVPEFRTFDFRDNPEPALPDPARKKRKKH